MKYNVERTALIDGDVFAYQAAAWAHSHQADVLELHDRVATVIDELKAQACCTRSIMTLSCKREDNFRREHYPLYKTNRTSEPPAMLEAAKRIMGETADRIVTMRGLEADDIMGILATNGKVKNPVIVTIDKDLRQIGGWHLNPAKEDFPVYVSEAEGDYLFYKQWLTGDTTDGFSGIKGVGPKKAEKVLIWGGNPEQVLREYFKAGMTLEQALAQARCARILRAEDWSSDNKRVIPYTPCGVALAAAEIERGDREQEAE